MSTKKLQILTPIVTSVNGQSGDVTLDIPSSITVDSVISNTSTNPVQNKVIYDKLVELSYGNPIDARADIVASGVSDVDYHAKWATLKANGGSGYRVPAGCYCDNHGYHTTIIIADGGGMRSVKIIYVADDGLSGIYFYTSTAPNEFYRDFTLAADEGYGGALYFRDGDCNRILPEYSTKDAGKFLRLNSKGEPEWQSLTNVAEEGA